MKFTINIKDSKVAAFIELLKNLDFIDLEDTEGLEGYVLTEAEKRILEEKISSYTNGQEQLLDWEELRKELE